LFEDFITKPPVTAKYISGIDTKKWLTHEWATEGNLSYGVKTSNVREQENSPTGILGKVRSLAQLTGVRMFLDLTLKRMVDVMNSITKEFKKHKQLQLEDLPAPFFHRMNNLMVHLLITLMFLLKWIFQYFLI